MDSSLVVGVLMDAGGVAEVTELINVETGLVTMVLESSGPATEARGMEAIQGRTGTVHMHA
jgi:hypothetical protein